MRRTRPRRVPDASPPYHALGAKPGALTIRESPAPLPGDSIRRNPSRCALFLRPPSARRVDMLQK